jgi:hypothetical protein
MANWLPKSTTKIKINAFSDTIPLIGLGLIGFINEFIENSLSTPNPTTLAGTGFVPNENNPARQTTDPSIDFKC